MKGTLKVTQGPRQPDSVLVVLERSCQIRAYEESRDPSAFSAGDWRHRYVGLEGPVVPSEKVRLDL